MKILGIILALLMLSGSALVGVTGAHKSRDAAKAISALTEGLTDAERDEVAKLGDMPSSGRLTFGAILGIVGAIGAAALLVATFAKKHLVAGLGAAAVIVTAMSAAIYPHIETGPTQGMAPRSQAMLATVLALVGVVGAVLASRRKA
jgi:hypothetical protein